MLLAVLNIRSSHYLSVILVALHLMAASWITELLKQPWCLPIPLEGHPLLTQEVYECPEVMSRQDITNPQIFTRGYSEGSVCQAWSQPRHCRLHQHQSEGLLDWLLWVPLEQIRGVLSEKCLNVFEVDSKCFNKYLLYLFEVDHYALSTMISLWTP